MARIIRRRSRRRSDKPLLLEELREDVQANDAVVDLEHALLERERQRTQFGKSVADPGCIVQRQLRRKILGPHAVDHQLEQAGERREGFWKLECRLRWQERHLSDDDTIGGDAARLHLKSHATFGFQMQYAELRHIPGHDSRLGPDGGEGYGCVGGRLVSLRHLLTASKKA